jgi:hypothetical protein
MLRGISPPRPPRADCWLKMEAPASPPASPFDARPKEPLVERRLPTRSVAEAAIDTLHVSIAIVCPRSSAMLRTCLRSFRQGVIALVATRTQRRKLDGPSIFL